METEQTTVAGVPPRDRVSAASDGSGAAEMEDAALVQAAGQGDRTAFRILMERHARTATLVAQRMLGNPHDADEVVQEAFLRVWTAAARWRPDGGATFRTWLHRIVANLCVDRLRRVRPLSLDALSAGAGTAVEGGGGGLAERPDPGPDPLAQHEATRRDAKLAQAIKALPERQQVALRLYYYEELSAPEAAANLKMSVSAFESLLVRGRRQLRQMLARAGLSND